MLGMGECARNILAYTETPWKYRGKAIMTLRLSTLCRASLLAIATLGAPIARADPLFNPSFEDGVNYPGWISNARALTSVVDDSPGPGYGTHSIDLIAGGVRGSNPFRVLFITEVRSLPFTMDAGETLFGAARFFSSDPFSSDPGSQFQHFGDVTITGGPGGLTIFSANSVGKPPGDTGWTFFQVTVPFAGTFFLTLDSYNQGDNLFPSEFRVDFAEPVSPVPEPDTYAMLLAGLGLLGFAARRRKLNLAA